MKVIYPEKTIVRYMSYMVLAVLVLLFLIIHVGSADQIVTYDQDVLGKPALAARVVTSTAPVESRDCLLAVQLYDPDTRRKYEAIIAAASTSVSNEDIVLDALSWQCLACHDGVLAIAARYRISDGTFYQSKSIETIKGAHPIGMDYRKFTMQRGYAAVESLPVDMVLMHGAVGCVTCHNLLGSNTYYHVVDNSSSRLCFSCHIK